jgi:hypothetical protein
MNDAKNAKGRWETVMVLDPNDPEHKHLIEKRIHHEEYEGQDLWMGKLFPSYTTPINSRKQLANMTSFRYG